MLIYSEIAKMRDALEACRKKVAEPIFSIPIFYIFRKHSNPFEELFELKYENKKSRVAPA